MKYLFTLLFILASSKMFAQQAKDTVPFLWAGTDTTIKLDDWNDTAFKEVHLQDAMHDKKIIVVEEGDNAAIYLENEAVRKRLSRTNNGYHEPDYDTLNHILDSAFAISDTVRMDEFRYDFDYIISDLLRKGEARVYSKGSHQFIPIITHRLERYGMEADRFFYLPDKRPFFSVTEVTGILDGTTYFSSPEESGKLYDKLSGMNKK